MSFMNDTYTTLLTSCAARTPAINPRCCFAAPHKNATLRVVEPKKKKKKKKIEIFYKMYSNCIKVKDKDIGTYVKAKYRIYEFAIGLKVSNSIIWVCWEVCVGQGERECVSRIFCLRSRLHSTDFVDYLRVRVITNETN